MRPGHLFDQIHLAQGVVAPVTGHDHLEPVAAPVRHRVSQRRQQGGDLLRRELHAEQMADARGPERHHRRLPGRGMDVDDLALNLPARHRHDQRCRPQQRPLHRDGIDAALEAVARVGGHAERAAGSPHLARLEQRTFQQDVRGPVRDFGVPSPP